MRTSYHQQKWALGCPITITLVSDQEEAKVNPVFAKLWVQILSFEKMCSRFLQNSELTMLNTSAGIATKVSPEFYEVVAKAKYMAEYTGDVYNPFVLPALQRAGYVRSMLEANQNDPQADFSDRKVVPSSKLVLKNGSITIPYGTALDLGGMGKGYLGDQLVQTVKKHSVVSGFWISLGGDTVCGGHDDQDRPWEVHVQSASPNGMACVSHIMQPSGGKTFAAATSTTNIRKGTYNGKEWHHIIDTTTGKPAQSDLLLATICTDSLLEADVLASCAIIAGSARAETFIMARKIKHYLFLTTALPKQKLIHSKSFYDQSVR